MRSIFGVAESGLRVSELRLTASADNVANALTPGFTPSRVESRDLPGGGVDGRIVKVNDPAAEARIDQAIVALSSRTDLGQQLVDQLLAAAAFRANLATLRTADDLLKAFTER